MSRVIPYPFGAICPHSEQLLSTLRGPLTWGPLVTFAAAASKMSYLGFGPLFWGLVLGTATSLILERRELAALRAAR